MAMAWDFPDPFTLPLQPKDSDIDGLNHTNNAVYVQWCAAASWRHSESLGLSATDCQRLDRGMAVHRAEYDYLRPALLGDHLTLGTWLLTRASEVRMERRLQLIRDSDGATLLRARWELVCIQISTGRPSRMPAEFRHTFLGGSAGIVAPHPSSS